MTDEEGTDTTSRDGVSEERPKNGVSEEGGDERTPETGDDDPEQRDGEVEIDVETALATIDEDADAELDPEVAAIRDGIETLEERIEAKNERIDELESRLKRKQADFENYKKRAKKRQDQIRERATENLVERLLNVRDNLKRALQQDDADEETLAEGVKMTLSEFDRVLDAENVTEIDPDPGTEPDPQRHEVLMNVESERPENTIVDVHRPGYEMADKVLRAAQVTVSDGSVKD